MRTRAFKLSLANWKLLYPVAICFQLLLVGTSSLTSLFGIPLLSSVIQLLVIILLYPFSTGLVCVYVRIWRGQPVTFRQLFDYYAERNRLIRVLLMASIVVLVPNILVELTLYIQSLSLSLGGAAVLVVFLTPVLLWLYMWITLRLNATQYILVTSEGIDPVKCVSASFSFMRGRCLRIFGFTLSLIPVPIVVLLALFIPLAFLYPQLILQANVAGSPIYLLVSQVLFALFVPFVQLATAGYFLDVLLKTPGKPPKNKLKVNDIYQK